MSDLRSFLTVGLCCLALGALAGPAAAQDDEDDFFVAEVEPLVAGEVAANKGTISVKTLTETNFAATTSTSFVDLATTTVTVPAARKGRILASFGGQVACEGGSLSGWCALRILVDGIEMLPQSNSEFAFSSPGDVAWETKSIDRVSHELSAGVHTVSLQWRIISPVSNFTLMGWQLKLALWRTA